MSFYSELAITVDELLTEFGQPLVITNFELGEEDPTTGILSQASSSYTTIGVLQDYDYRNFGDATNLFQTVRRGDKQILASATKLINPGDFLFIDGIQYKAYVVKCVNPGGTRVLYEIWAQR